MKRTILVLIMLLSIAAVAIGAVMVAGIAGNGEQRSGFDIQWEDGERTLLLDTTQSLADIDSIVVALGSYQVNVILTNEENITVKHYTQRSGLQIGAYSQAQVSTAGSELTISRTGGFHIFMIGSNRNWVEIYLPRSYHDKLRFEMSSGSLTISDELNVSELSVRLSSGEIMSESKITAPHTDIQLTSGKISLLGGVAADTYSFRVSSGTLRVEQMLAGSGDVSITSGTIELSGVDIMEKLNVSTTSGRVKLALVGNPSLDFSASVTSGKVDTYFPVSYLDKNGKQMAATIGDEPRKELTLRVTSGSITISEG